MAFLDPLEIWILFTFAPISYCLISISKLSSKTDWKIWRIQDMGLTANACMQIPYYSAASNFLHNYARCHELDKSIATTIENSEAKWQWQLSKKVSVGEQHRSLYFITNLAKTAEYYFTVTVTLPDWKSEYTFSYDLGWLRFRRWLMSHDVTTKWGQPRREWTVFSTNPSLLKQVSFAFRYKTCKR